MDLLQVSTKHRLHPNFCFKPCCLFQVACIRPVERSFTEEHLGTRCRSVLFPVFQFSVVWERNRSVRLLGHTMDPRPHLGGTDPSNVPGPLLFHNGETTLGWLYPKNDARLCPMDAQALFSISTWLSSGRWPNLSTRFAAHAMAGWRPQKQTKDARKHWRC